MSLEVLSPRKAFTASADVTEIDAGAQRCISLATSNDGAVDGWDSPAPGLFGEIGNGDRDREGPGVLAGPGGLARGRGGHVRGRDEGGSG